MVARSRGRFVANREQMILSTVQENFGYDCSALSKRDWEDLVFLCGAIECGEYPFPDAIPIAFVGFVENRGGPESFGLPVNFRTLNHEVPPKD